MLRKIAHIARLDTSHMLPIQEAPSTPIPRDIKLDCSKLERALDAFPARTPLSQGLAVCLNPFLQFKALGTEVERPTSPRCEAAPTGPCISTMALASAVPDHSSLQDLFWQELERTRARLQDARKAYVEAS